MDRLKKPLLGLLAVGALALGGAAIAGATSGGDESGTASDQREAPDNPVSSAAASRAKAAALARTGGGTAGHIEADTEKGATYEVEVTKPDGSQVDVRIDAGFNVVAVDSDSEQTGEHTGEN
jgi:uncharacterized membrane protein YkoI